MKIDFLKLIVSLVVCQLAGIIGSVFTAKSIPTWYAALEKPAFNPPNWVFAPVWTLLFIMMGISLYLVWTRGLDAPGVKLAIMIFAVQLVLNIVWSILFFGLQSPLYGLIEIVLLWSAILATIILFYGISKTASYLLIPYIAWVSFAAMLNFYLWYLNK